MNGKSNQGIVLSYSFLAKNEASINFSTREMRLGEVEVVCLKNEVDQSSRKKPIYAGIN